MGEIRQSSRTLIVGERGWRLRFDDEVEVVSDPGGSPNRLIVVVDVGTEEELGGPARTQKIPRSAFITQEQFQQWEMPLNHQTQPIGLCEKLVGRHGAKRN